MCVLLLDANKHPPPQKKKKKVVSLTNDVHHWYLPATVPLRQKKCLVKLVFKQSWLAVEREKKQQQKIKT